MKLGAELPNVVELFSPNPSRRFRKRSPRQPTTVNNSKFLNRQIKSPRSKLSEPSFAYTTLYEKNMDIFMKNIPPHANNRELKKDLERYVRVVGVFAYSVHIFGGGARGKSSAQGILTLPTIQAGRSFLDLFGDGYHPPLNPVIVLSRRISCRISDRPVDKHKVQSLLKEQQNILMKISQHGSQPSDSGQWKKKFDIVSIECGVWSTEAQSVPIFQSYYSLMVTNGTLQFEPQAVQADFSNPQLDAFDAETLQPLLSRSGSVRVDKKISIPYAALASPTVTSEYHQVGEIIFTLGNAPKIYRKIDSGSIQNSSDLAEIFKQLGIVRMFSNEDIPWERVSSLDEDHACFAPFAFVYRFRLKDVSDVNYVQQLDGKKGIPEIGTQRTALISGRNQFVTFFKELATKMLKDFEFPVAFQLNALFANGILPPYAIVRLLPEISRLVGRFGTAGTAAILKSFVLHVPLADPLGELHVLSHESLMATLISCARNTPRLTSAASIAIEQSKSQTGMAYVYHAMITPAGCYFHGPKLDTLNRVLRKYPEHHEYFLRVTFCDEDGDQMMFEPRVSQRPIYDGQFRHYLSREQIVVAGRSFQFLGFSSSSLRSQSCWFMAPFVFNGELLDSARVISNLGDFASITCPGRCAARIGQAFSDTVSSVDVPMRAEVEIPDIIRDGRNFSDGVGTISQDMLERIWAMSEKKYQHKPTILQIRFAGAKGVVSLDTRLSGSQLCLRDSMIKFRGSTDRNIEICSTAGWLPMVLNRPLIKVLEDLGVADETFKSLQQDAVERIRESTKSVGFAANFLKRQRITSGSNKLPWMIEALHNLKLNFRDDKFLEKAFELALLTALRDLKHRARIPVPEGVTLIGIVDETGVLEEGEIYCPYKWDDGKEGLVTGHVLITRSPVHHPGDVQMAVAVTDLNIPEDSPLKALKNCVVFSQKGSRDLPSKLAGGDLDGDLYNVVFDSRFSLKKLFDPAEYPRVEPKNLGRQVQSEDIVDFFIDFMQNNLLGLISIRHLIIADQQKAGVNDPDCLKLAQMASTAVDFPKTGVKVDKSELPRCSPIRPDFLAPGPRMFVNKERTLVEAENMDEEDGDDNVGIKYYESEKILGELYRAIDETAFLREMQEEVKQDRAGRDIVSVIDGVWNYLENKMPDDCYWYHESRFEEAKDIKDSYERSILELMHSYSDTPWKGSKISEVEVFIGKIVGNEKQTKRQREASATMRDEYEALVWSVMGSIRGQGREDSFAVGMACLYLCKKDRETQGPQNGLQSFAWVAASFMLSELDRIQKFDAVGKKSRTREFY